MTQVAPGENQGWLSAIVENSSDLIIVLDAGAAVVYANPAATRTFGVGLEEAAGATPERFVHPDDIDRLLAHHAELVASPGRTHRDTVRFITKAGDVRVLETIATNHIDNPEVQGIVVNGRDVTERDGYIRRLEETFDDVTVAISNAIDRRDPYTAGHQREVAAIAVAIATELGLSEAETKGIEVAATLHDIGKISVPAEILSRPGRLSRAEYELIKGHAQTGHDIVADVAFPWPVAQMILQHHERLDGSGYPNSLPSKAIYTGSRVIAVADVLSAMSAHRPYRSALGIDVALDELESGKGQRFDTAAVDACARLVRDGRLDLGRPPSD
jgi:PAS domain S-box-containing protein/putative nucleotidyltransferase with HDIG domain